IHALKYRGNEEIGIFLGNWFGEILKENNQFDDIDYIIPVALHPKKRKQRGYNQVSKFGKIIGFHLKNPFLEHILLRTTISKTQTFKARFERFNTIDSPFHLQNTSFLKNKHILLIDDVITTGATIEACAKELQKIENVKISILSMAYTE
ncbi:MAG: ComF family protein, partial [Polaribacter sp.]|nr:ComF family protein [Polaribacter sp.]